MYTTLETTALEEEFLGVTGRADRVSGPRREQSNRFLCQPVLRNKRSTKLLSTSMIVWLTVDFPLLFRSTSASKLAFKPNGRERSSQFSWIPFAAERMSCQSVLSDAGKLLPAASVATQTSHCPAVWGTECTADHILFQYFSTVELECFTIDYSCWVAFPWCLVLWKPLVVSLTYCDTCRGCIPSSVLHCR